MKFKRMRVMRQRTIPMRRLDNVLDWVMFVQWVAEVPLSVCMHVATMKNAVLGNGTRILDASTRNICIPVKVPEMLSHSNRLWVGGSNWHPEVILGLAASFSSRLLVPISNYLIALLHNPVYLQSDTVPSFS